MFFAVENQVCDGLWQVGPIVVRDHHDHPIRGAIDLGF